MIDTLRRVGYTRLADEASRVLPDEVDRKQLEELAGQHAFPATS